MNCAEFDNTWMEKYKRLGQLFEEIRVLLKEFEEAGFRTGVYVYPPMAQAEDEPQMHTLRAEELPTMQDLMMPCQKSRKP